jgi:8-oxo-dGTP pyrophosphatase MutT (NUDIX family)
MSSAAERLRLLSEGLSREEEQAEAAVAVILDREAVRVLLIRRSEREGDRWAGQIALPGGLYRPEDASPIKTAIREAKEEVGLDLRPDLCLGHLGAFSPLSRPGMRVIPYVFALKDEPRLMARPEEVKEVRWVPLRGLSKAKDEKGKAYAYEDWVIWGLTARILAKLMRLLGLPY